MNHFITNEPCQLKANASKRKCQSTTNAAVPGQKRSKACDSVENDEEQEEKKRSRGRPRLDTKDETAADRRRTQIRLAQRAYRHRKDNEITTLAQKVKDLEKANEDMRKEFMNFYDFFLSQGLMEGAPEVARRLNDTTRKFLSFTRKSVEDPAKDDVPAASPSCETDHTKEPHGRGLQWTPSPASSHDGYSATSEAEVPATSSGTTSIINAPSISSLDDFGAASHLPYEIITQATMENASFPVYDTQGQLPFFGNAFGATPFSAPPAPSSYAFQERSFGRRLQRATLEAGLKLVSLQNPPPHRYAAVFGFCLLFESREAIIRRLKSSLSRTRQESMYVWKYPFTNLGGAGFNMYGHDGPQNPLSGGSAGTEFPVGNQGVREFYKPADMTGFSMGPFSSEVETTRDDRVDHRMRMMYRGFEGDFYDADEVDTYLRQRGIVIPENADFIEAEIDVTAFQEAPTLGPTMGDAGGEKLFRGVSVPATSEIHSLSSNDAGMWATSFSTSMTPSVMPMAPPGGTPMATQQGPVVPNLPVTSSAHFDNALVSYGGNIAFPWAEPQASTWMKTRVSLDVALLVVEMVGRAVCLGRTPGLRRKDVDTAVRIATGLERTL